LRVVVPMSCCDDAAEYLIDALGGESVYKGKSLVGQSGGKFGVSMGAVSYFRLFARRELIYGLLLGLTENGL
jgi:hypothetical protein